MWVRLCPCPLPVCQLRADRQAAAQWAAASLSPHLSVCSSPEAAPQLWRNKLIRLETFSWAGRDVIGGWFIFYLLLSLFSWHVSVQPLCDCRFTQILHLFVLICFLHFHQTPEGNTESLLDYMIRKFSYLSDQFIKSCLWWMKPGVSCHDIPELMITGILRKRNIDIVIMINSWFSDVLPCGSSLCSTDSMMFL